MLWILVFVFAAAIAATPLHRLLGARAVPLLSLAPAIALGWLLSANPQVERYAWLPPLGIELAFAVDGLARLFAVLVLGIGVAVLVYSASSMRHDPRAGDFFARMLFFTGAMLGLVVADDLVSLYVFWELTTVASFFLIGWKSEQRTIRDAARTALIVTAAGGLALLAALVLIAITAGSTAGADAAALSISALNERGLQDQSAYSVVVSLVLVAAVAKSALVPLWFWLPGAMQAPTPVSAYLHSATMVKAGVFLLARLSPALGDTTLWTVLLTSVGGATMVLAGIGAIAQSDLKRLLAFSTISILGAIVFLLGLGSREAVAAAVVLIVAHALYKAALFLVAGGVEKATGTRDLRRLGGLAGALPLTTVTAVLAGASLAAAPPFLGYVAKEKLYAAALSDLGAAGLMVAFAGGLTMVVVALMCGARPFFGRRRLDRVRSLPAGMIVPPFVLAILGLTSSFVPGPLRAAMSDATSAIAAAPHAVELSLWPGTDAKGMVVLLASGATLVVGFLAYQRRAARAVASIAGLGDQAMRRSDAAAARLGGAVMSGVEPLTRLYQSGRLRRYLQLLLGTIALAAATPLVLDPQPLARDLDLTSIELGTLAIVNLGAIGAAAARRSLTAVASLGATGLGIALLFGILSAPDLAITQVMVEALLVVVFVLCFYRLRTATAFESQTGRMSDAALAGILGALLAVLVLAAATVPLEAEVARAIAAASVPVGEGRNVVNVILVDVRSLDTLGEITVLGAAGLGAIVLLRRRKERS